LSDKKKVPDNVVSNPHSLPYGSNLSAPAIKPNNLGAWKNGAVHSTNKYFKEKFDELKKQAEELSEEFKWNEIIFNAQMKFKPVIGKEYFLYQKQNGTFYLTLFAPHERIEGYEGYQGKFRLNYDSRWEQVI